MKNKIVFIREKVKRVIELKRLLAATDYQAIKYSEGEMTMSEYSMVREQRRSWRAEINALESEIAALGG